MKNTPQRMEIKKYLKNNKSHPSAYDIYRTIKKKLPTISFATVYNNLERMVKDNELIEIEVDKKKRFDPDISPHDHFLCIACGNIYDIPKVISDVRYKNFKTISHITYIKGLCEKCINKEGIYGK